MRGPKRGCGTDGHVVDSQLHRLDFLRQTKTAAVLDIICPEVQPMVGSLAVVVLEVAPW